MSETIDAVNRFVIVVVTLLVVFAALLLIVLAWGAPDASIDRVEDFAGWLRRHNDRETKVVTSLLAAVVSFVGLSILILELTPSPTQRLRVRNVRSADAVITTGEIAQRINAEVLRAPHIASCASIVAARGKRVEVVLDLHVDPGADLAQAADDACRRAHELVERQLGIPLAQRPRARLHYRELRLRSSHERVPDALVNRHNVATGWERPRAEEERDDGRRTDASEEAQA
jgi:hypothetical protein